MKLRKVDPLAKYVATLATLALVPVLSGCRTEPAAPAEPVESVAWVADGVITADEYTDTASDGGYEIFWRRDGDDILIGMRAEATGWVAVGFEPQLFHRMTDTIIGNVTDAGVAVYDMYSTAELGPCAEDTELGGSDDIIEFGGREADGMTVIEFRRAMDTGDEYDGVLVSGANEIIWASSNNDDPLSRHLLRGHLEITIP